MPVEPVELPRGQARLLAESAARGLLAAARAVRLLELPQPALAAMPR